MKEGLFAENGELIYYEHDRPKHAGAVKIGQDIYYIGSGGRAVKGTHVVHGEMCNGILKHGTYKFGDDYKLVKGSYKAPAKVKKTKKHKSSLSADPKALLGGGVILLTIGLLLLAVFRIEKCAEARDPGPGAVTEKETAAELILPQFDADVRLCSDASQKVYAGELTVAEALAGGNPYRAFEFPYTLPTDGSLLLSEYPDMQNAQEYVLSADESLLQIDNLKTGTQYYYKVLVNGKTYPGSFRTAKSTRFINLPGLRNTRDIGGYTTLDGKKARQGLVIRGTELDGLVEPGYFLDKEYLAYTQETFGFACDMDLRSPEIFNGVYQSRFGQDVLHRFYDAPMYGSIFTAAFQPSIRQIFTDLADPDNYPVYIHCTYGADRTGTICFLLEGVLNYPEEVMYNDYRWTEFFHRLIGAAEGVNSIYGGLEGYAGDTIQEKIVHYLVETVGVTEEQIESIRRIFLED
ncbi:MAG: tyrosine-protein phosphatase [Clostridia bacterium]|nr:tyrosine-protein phosphatase [Clostridia bacterium]